MSDQPLFRVRREKQVPVPVIEDDFHRVRRDINTKVSAVTLQYLNRKGVCTFPFYTFYKEAVARPGDSTTELEKKVIIYINEKFIKHYERI